MQCAHLTFRPYTPIVKKEKYPPILALKSKLPPYIFFISGNILIDGGLKYHGHINSYVLLYSVTCKVR